LPYPSVASSSAASGTRRRSCAPVRNDASASGWHRLVVRRPSSLSSPATGEKELPSGHTASMSPSPICAHTSQ
jgi:hypothetical protein